MAGWKRKQKVEYIPFNKHSNGPNQCMPVIGVFYGVYQWSRALGMVKVYDSFMVGLN